MDAHRSETWFLGVSLAALAVLAWCIVTPYVSAVVLAGTLAFLFRPLYQRFLRIVHYESVAAIGVVVVVTLIVFIPLGFFGVRIFGEATSLYTSLSLQGGFDFGGAINSFLHAHLATVYPPEATFPFDDYVRQGLTWIIQNLGSFFSQIAQIFFTAFLSLLGLFYFLKDGERLKRWVLETIPLAPKYTEAIVREMDGVASSIVKGTLLVALMQGIVVGVGFLLFSIPHPTFWGTLVVPASLIPIVGTWLIALPAVAYLFLTGQTLLGACLLVWNLILVNIIYNVISPQLMHRGVDIHPYLILLSILGGIGLFGPIGLLMGPLAIALLFSLLKIYAGLIAGRRG